MGFEISWGPWGPHSLGPRAATGGAHVGPHGLALNGLVGLGKVMTNADGVCFYTICCASRLRFTRQFFGVMGIYRQWSLIS
jgi:hypothetical protein